MSNFLSGRKKVRKACVPCSKSKIGCDFQRPCTNCVRRGVSDQCCDKKDFYQRKKSNFPEIIQENSFESNYFGHMHVEEPNIIQLLACTHEALDVTI